MNNHPEDTSDRDRLHEQFVSQLTNIQASLYAYICALLGGTHDAADVLQETNLVLWRKASEFDTERDFGVWARKFAYVQVLSYRQGRTRNRHVSNFSEEALDRIAARLETSNSEFAHRQRLLDDCAEKLSAYQQTLIQLRYVDGLEVKTISNKLSKPENNIATALYRARVSLIDCVKASPDAGGTP